MSVDLQKIINATTDIKDDFKNPQVNEALDMLVRHFKEIDEEEVIVMSMKKKKEVEIDLFEIYHRIGIATPSNHDKILDYVYSDVNDCADKEDWHSGDVAIAFRRFLERKEVCDE